MSNSAENTQLRLINLMADLFRCDTNEINETTGPGDIDGWDSLGHVSLMSEIESQFGLHVPVEDALEVTSVADLVGILDRLSSEAS